MNNSQRESILPKLRYILQNSLYMEKQALRHILDYRLISIQFRPIKTLPSGSSFACQALVRGPQGSNYELPNSLFAAATYYKCRWEMEALYLQEAMADAANHLNDQYLFLTIDPKFMTSREYDADFLIHCLNSYQLAPKRIVLDIGNPGKMIDNPVLELRLSFYRSAGLKLAIHDFGTGPIKDSVTKFKPDFVIMPLAPEADKSGENTAFSEMVETCCQVGAATIFEEIWEGSYSYLWEEYAAGNGGTSPVHHQPNLRSKEGKMAAATTGLLSYLQG